MKQKNTFKIALLLLTVVAFACAKERSPKLHIAVFDERGFPVPNATVHAWPGDNALDNTVNEAEMDKTGVTDLSGNVTFDFKFSAVLDVDVVYYRTTEEMVSDTLLSSAIPPADSIYNHVVTLTDSLSGHRVVKIESVRQKSVDNDFYETINLK